MMTPEGMEEVVQVLIARGYPRATAEDYSARLGDTIEEDAEGRWIIRGDQGEVLEVIDSILE